VASPTSRLVRRSALTRTTITLTLPAPSVAGTLLVAEPQIRHQPLGTSHSPRPPDGVSANNAFLNGTAHTEIWYYPNNPGGISSAAFGLTPNSIDGIGQMTEWRNVAVSPPERTGTLTVQLQPAHRDISSSPATTMANELVITDDGFNHSAGQTVLPAAGLEQPNR